jgi:hypothetical protein
MGLILFLDASNVQRFFEIKKYFYRLSAFFVDYLHLLVFIVRILLFILLIIGIYIDKKK